jgi:hypothetical protein
MKKENPGEAKRIALVISVRQPRLFDLRVNIVRGRMRGQIILDLATHGLDAR